MGTLGFQDFHGICPKQCGNYAFLRNFHTWKLDEITKIYAMQA